jgi:predicted flap endonuclease-1-like 5' DNA nuclease
MLYLIQTFWLPLAIVLIGGLTWGWITAGRAGDRGRSAWVSLAAFVLVVALVAALLQWLPGRSGLWLDVLLIFLAAFLAGCVIGSVARQTRRGERVEEAIERMEERAETSLNPPAGMVDPHPHVVPGEALSAAGTAAAEAMARGTRPEGLESPRGAADDLKLISGIGRQNEARLHALGVWHFDQVAAWTAEESLWVGGYLAFPGRIERENWVGQAKILAGGGSTDFADRARRGEVPTSSDDGTHGHDNVADLAQLHGGTVPPRLVGPRLGAADDLTLVSGIGPEIQARLYELGIWHFDQIAAMSEAELAFVSGYVGFPGRALRENWAAESRVLAAGGETEHARAVRSGRTA